MGLVFLALVQAACSGDPTEGDPSGDGAAPEVVAAGPPSGNGPDVAMAALDAVTRDAPLSEEVGADDGPGPDEDATEDASVTWEVGVFEVGIEEGDVPIEPPDAGVGVDVPVAPPRDVGADVPVAPPLDAGADVPVAPPLDVGVDVPVVPPRDVGVDVPVVPPRDVGVDVPVAPPLDVGVDVPVAPLDVGVDIGVDVVAPRDLGPPPVGVGVLPAVTGVPRIDGALKALMRAVYLRGLAAGNRPSVFVKVGDSITHSGSYLADYGPTSGLTRWPFGAYTAFEPTRAYFNATLVDDRHSSFDRESLSADSGWTSTRALESDAMLLRQELSTLRPSVALVMLGSGDVDVNEVPVFTASLTRVVQIILAANVIPVLSTIPRRINSPTTIMMWPSFVAAIREVAAAQRVPLQDYWTAMETLPGHGLSEDGEHPSVYRTPGGTAEASFLTPEGLAFGYNLRNLQTLATLAHVRAVIFEDGPADP